MENRSQESQQHRTTSASAGFGAGVLAGGLVGTLAGLLWRWRRAERPPIIVKGGSVIFVHEVDSSGKQLGWSEDDEDNWTPAQCDGDHITKLSAEILQGGTKDCPPRLEGTLLQITYEPPMGSPVKLIIRVHKGAPRIQQRKGLRAESKDLKYGDDGVGKITEIRSGSQFCPLEGEVKIRIWCI